MARHRFSFLILIVALFQVLATVARADITDTWTVGATTASTAVRGITVSYSGTSGGAYTNDTFATTTYWTNNYSGTVSGGASLNIDLGTGSTTITVTFSEPVNNPILHVDRQGGNSTGPNSSRWNLTSSVSQGGTVTLNRLSGNTVFIVSGTAFQRQTGAGGTGGTDCLTTGNTAACGSIEFQGTGITQLTFAVAMAGNVGIGDLLEMRWSFVGSNVIIRKQSVSGTGTFNFTGSGDITATALNTATSNPISSSAFTIADHSSPITITEAAQTGWTITGTSCLDQNSATVASSLSGQTLTIAAAAYGGNQTITCTFTNTRSATLQLRKSWQNAALNDAVSIPATTGFANNTTALSAVANTATENDDGTAVTVLVGNSGTLSAESFTAGSAANYATTLSCSGGTLSGTNAQASNTLTINTADGGTAILCTYLNSRVAQQVNLAKTWTNGAASNAISVTTTGGTANPTLTSTVPGPTTGSAVTAYAGDILTLPAETFTNGSAANYTIEVECTGGSTLARGATGRQVTISTSAAATTCRYYNTRLAQQFNLAKSWAAGSFTGHTASATTTNAGTGSTATFSSTAPTATTGTAVTVYAGDAITLPVETFANSSASAYTASITCAGGSTLAAGAPPRSLTITSSTTATTCTYTNTPAFANLVTVKTLDSGSPNPALTGQTVTWRIAVTNNGPAAASNVNLSDNFPATLTVTGASTSPAATGSTSVSGNTVSWSGFTLASGASATLLVTATVN